MPGQPPMMGQPPMPGQPPMMGQPPKPGQPPIPGMMAPPGQPGAGGGFGGAASPRGRTLDPDSMPSPIQVMEEDQLSNTKNGGYFDTREKGAPPPLVTTKF